MGDYLLISNASQREKHTEGNMFLYEQSPEQRVSTVLLKGHKKCPHKDTVHFTHTHLNSNESICKLTNAAHLTKKRQYKHYHSRGSAVCRISEK